MLHAFSYHIALNRAVNAAGGRHLIFDYSILYSLSLLGKAVSFYKLYVFMNNKVINGSGTFNSKYYAAVARLIAQGYVTESYYSARRWRRWTITIKGKLELKRLNDLAEAEYLKMQDLSK